jgi:ABC-2 type transport system permease protein
MKTITKIARTELSLLFYSPIAWFLLVVFMFQCGLSYTDHIDNYLISQQLGGARSKQLGFLTQGIFAFPYGILAAIKNYVYLYLPLLTMGLISREISSGTIKLLYSSPTRVKEIVLGKFLSMMVFSAVLTGVLALFAIIGMFNIQHADIPLMLSGLFAIYLLMCTYSAIGLFMSSLTSYQIVAAVSTLALLGLLNYVGTLWQDMDFVRDLTHFLSISGRTETMMMGLITTRDVLYFLIIIVLFLAMTIFKLHSTRRTIPVWIKVGRYAAYVVIALIVGYVSNRQGWNGYWDVTATKSMTITEGGQKITKSMNGGPLKVTSYINLLDNFFWMGQPKQRNTDLQRWDRYIRFKSDIELNYVYYYDSTYNPGFYKYNKGQTNKQLAERYATSSRVDIERFKTPEEIRKIIDLRPEENKYVMKLEYQGKTTFLRLFNDQFIYPTETETSAAMKRLMTKAPVIAFAQGQLQRSADKKGDREYQVLTNEKSFRHAMVNQGFDVINVNLTQSNIPDSIAALVIADPRTPFDTASLTRIRAFIDKGGNLLIAGEPGKQDLLNPLLQPLGVQLEPGTLVQKSEDFSPDLVLNYLTDTAATLSKALARSKDDSMCISTPGAAALSYTTDKGFAVQPLMMTDAAKTWIKKSELVTDSATIEYKPEEGDRKGAFAVAVKLTRKINNREQRIVVIGDADFLSNKELVRYNPRTANFNFNTAIFGWFTYGDFPINSSRPESRDNKLNLTKESFKLLKIICIGIFPALLLVIGSILLIRRKRK